MFEKVTMVEKEVKRCSYMKVRNFTTKIKGDITNRVMVFVANLAFSVIENISFKSRARFVIRED